MKAGRKARRSARHLYRLCLDGGRLDPARVRLVGARLAASARRGALPILGEFLRLVRLDTDRHTAVVESAAPLGDEQQARIRADLARRYGPAIAATFRDNPGLIGGLRIRVGSDVYDDSVRARLAALAGRL